MTDSIEDFSDIIKANRKRFKRNRDLIAGEDAVKRGGSNYLPRLAKDPQAKDPQASPNSYDGAGFSISDLGDEDRPNFLALTPFFPAAARTAQGYVGLAFRKAPTFTPPESLIDVFDTITLDGHTMEDLAKEVFTETLTTNFSALLVDHAEAVEGLNAANAIAQGYRPFITLYKAEQIHTVERKVIRNKRMLSRVVLRDHAEQIRELLLEDDVYKVIVHIKGDNGWVAQAPIVPMKRGVPWNEIPLVIVSHNTRSLDPTKGIMDDLVQLNLQLYRAQLNVEMCSYYVSEPFLVFENVETHTVNIKSGTSMFLNAPINSAVKSQVEWVGYEGKGLTTLMAQVATLKDECAAVGMRILAPEKAAAEAAETLAIRRASETATQAAFSRSISKSLEEALWFVCEWMGIEALSYELSSDFVPEPMDPATLQALIVAWQAGVFSIEVLHDLMVDGDILPEGFDGEADQAKVEAANLNVDRPVGAPRE